METTSEIIRLRNEGYGYKSISKLTGLSRDKVRFECKKADLTGCRSQTHGRRPDGNKTEIKSYKTCLFCGLRFEPYKGKLYCCDECKAKYKAQKNQQGPRDPVECPVCHTMFVPQYRQKYCSKKCGKKWRGTGQIYRVPRDERLSKCTSKDSTLWLLPLVKRDNNKCALCGGDCDLYDYEVTEHGAVVCGDSYPSIDHIIPIAKGGQHVWENVQLAHRGCNRKKSDTI